MQPVSPEFIDGLRFGATIKARADLYRGREKVREIPLESGNVTVDSSASQRRRCTVQVALDADTLDLIPAATHKSDAGLWPIGTELNVVQTMTYKHFTPEPISLGWFRIAAPSVDDSGDDLTLRVEGFDVSMRIARNKFIHPYQIIRGQDYATQIKVMLMDRDPSLSEGDFLFYPTDGSDGAEAIQTPDLLLKPGDDGWAKGVEMAASLGFELFVDPQRRFVLRPLPDLENTVPSFTYSEGEFSVLESVSRELDESDAYNGVVLSASNSTNDADIQAVAWDMNPNSPTYYDPNNPGGSLYGPYPKFIQSDKIASQRQADIAVKTELQQLVGIVENVQFNSICNFAHEGNDVIGVSRERINVNGYYVLTGFNIPLGTGMSMSGTTRSRPLGDFGDFVAPGTTIFDPFNIFSTAGTPRR